MKHPIRRPYAALEDQLKRHKIRKQDFGRWMGIAPSTTSGIIRGVLKPTRVQLHNMVTLTRFLQAREVSVPPQMPAYKPAPFNR